MLKPSVNDPNRDQEMARYKTHLSGKSEHNGGFGPVRPLTKADLPNNWKRGSNLKTPAGFKIASEQDFEEEKAKASRKKSGKNS